MTYDHWKATDGNPYYDQPNTPDHEPDEHGVEQATRYPDLYIAMVVRLSAAYSQFERFIRPTPNGTDAIAFAKLMREEIIPAVDDFLSGVLNEADAYFGGEVLSEVGRKATMGLAAVGDEVDGVTQLFHDYGERTARPEDTP